jgi:hypothetical protein
VAALALAALSVGCGAIGEIAWDSLRYESIRNCDRIAPSDERAACRARVEQAEAQARREQEASARQARSAEARAAATGPQDPTRDGSGRCFRRESTGELVCAGN